MNGPKRNRPPGAKRAAEMDGSVDNSILADQVCADRWAEHVLEAGWDQLNLNVSHHCSRCGTVSPEPECPECGQVII